MHRLLRARLHLRSRRADDRGIAALAVALAMVALLVASAMVLDLGLVRVDRQVDKSAADAATLAGVAALNSGDAKPHPFRGVCAALRYMQANDPRFGGLTDSSGAWSDGTGATTANGCTTAGLQSLVCSATSLATWAKFTWNGTYAGEPLKVQIQSGYLLGTDGWREDTSTAAVTDQSDGAGGCYQLAVTVTQNRKPGLGSIARSADLVTSVRSVGRIKLSPGGYAPAMLLLKRTGCTSLEIGSTAGTSWVKVYGTITPTGVSQPGTIHADTNGLSCGTSVFYGKAANGIIAYAAPLASGLPDASKPGEISSVAGLSGLSTAYDSISNVYGSSLLSGTGSPRAPVGRDLITRLPVDTRYLAGVRQAVTAAQSGVFGSGLTAANAASPAFGYKVATCSSGDVTLPGGLVATDKLYIDCPMVKSAPSIVAQTVVFNGSVAPGNTKTIAMPNATHVYIFGSSTHALDLTNGAFKMHNASPQVDGYGNCLSDPVVGSKATLFMSNGDLNEANGGSLQLCNTTVFMMGGRSDACLPVAYTDVPSAPAPTQSPCSGINSNKGNGQVKQTGGDVDWTAPNVIGDTLDANGDPTVAATTAWSDPDGPEDLALWDESAGNSSSDKYQFTGGGSIHLQGIFMVPNADPISLSGSASFVLSNAQFVATSLALASSNTTLSMTVDPYSAVTLPKLKTIGLVR